MKIPAWGALALLLLIPGTVVVAAESPVAPKPEAERWQSRVDAATALKAVNLFRKDPAGDDALSALALVMAFAEESDQVAVTLKPAYLPWIDDPAGKDLDERVKARLTGAFVAGNVEAQLRSRIKGNSPYEGVLLVLHAYRELRGEDLVPKLEALEKWGALEGKGELRKLVNGL